MHNKGRRAALRDTIISWTDLQSDKLVVNHDFLREEISADGGLVLVAEPLVNVLVHERRLADTAKTNPL